MKNLIIGLGEIGTAMRSILECDGYDLGHELEGEYDIIHICFPYSSHFYSYVKDYQKKFNAKYTVIHATVPVGTSRKLGAIHSPVRGVHPHLEQSIRTFVKYFGGENTEAVSSVFLEKGIKVAVCDKPETTELMKIVDTTGYGVNILIEKEIYRLCEEYGVSFKDVYTEANRTYNEGYENIGMPQFKKYILEHKEGKIGGHCIMPNAELLDTWMNSLLKEKNK